MISVRMSDIGGLCLTITLESRMPTESTAILIPAMRPDKVWDLYCNIEDTTPEPHTVWWAVDSMRDFPTLSLLSPDSILVDGGGTWGRRLNALFTLSTDPYIFTGADDVHFHPGWLTEAYRMMALVDGVVAVNDGLNPRGTLALVSRRYIDEESGCVDVPGVIIYPGYHHFFSETELFDTAESRGRFAYAAYSVVEHYHHVNGKAPDDWVYDLGRQTALKDEWIYNSRCHMWQGEMTWRRRDVENYPGVEWNEG